MPAKPHRKLPSAARHAHQIRIIGGQWKRTPLPVLDATGLRPTPDRVRETVFNWLHHVLGGAWNQLTCLDLFAGTGALGFEAASRGASQVLMVESHPSIVRQLEAIKTKLHATQVAIVRDDALSAAQHLAKQATRFHLIFLDPPYHHDWLAKILPHCERLLTAGGIVYAESEAPLTAEVAQDWLAPWDVIKTGQAGMVFYHLLQRKGETGFQA